MRTNINGNSVLVCSIQKWDIVVKDDSQMSLIMRHTDYLEKQEGAWKVLHEHTSNVPIWDGKIDIQSYIINNKKP